MKKSILLIEDSESDFKRVRSFFKSYDVDFYPSSEDEFEELSTNLILYTRPDSERKSTFFNEIIKCINKVNPTIILLDLGLSGEKESINRDGLEILNWIKKNLSPSLYVFIFSRYENNRSIKNIAGYIQKEGQQLLEKQLLELIVRPCIISKKSSPDIVELKEFPKELNVDTAKKTNINTDIDERNIEEYKPSRLEKVSDFFYIIQVSWIPLFADAIITFIFQISIVLLFILAPVDIIINSGNKLDSFRIAERCFIAFLPFLIVCGFYIFYKKSLRSYFLKTVSNPDDEDFESASILMKLTKRLFVSSLLSYLFIKLIELLFFEKPERNENYFLKYYGITNPFIQLYITSGLIVILIVYYLLLDGHHSSGKNKQE